MATKKTAKAKKPGKPIPPLHINHQAWDKAAVMAIVCERVASSTKSMVTILADGYEGNPLPTYTAVKEWLSGSEALAAQYARAKEDQADFMGEEMAELHNKAWIPVLVDGVPLMVDGKPLMTVDKASVALVRLEADNKKWLMGKLRPKKYGDRTTLAGDSDNPLAVLTMNQITANPASRIKVGK